MIETNLIKLASLTATHLGPQPFAQDSGKPKLRTKDSDFIDKRRSFKAKWRHLINYSIYVKPCQATWSIIQTERPRNLQHNWSLVMQNWSQSMYEFSHHHQRFNKNSHEQRSQHSERENMLPIYPNRSNSSSHCQCIVWQCTRTCETCAKWSTNICLVKTWQLLPSPKCR